MAYKSGLDPENDPIVYTTDYGLNIRYANTTTYLPEYTYFTVGGYNWIIIGYDPSLHYLVGEYTGQIDRNPTEGDQTQMSTIDGTPAGTAILKDMFAISQAAQTDFEIGEGCVLCLAETRVDNGNTVQFNTSTSQGNNYKGSNLQKYIDETIYGGTSELSKALQNLPIEPQKLTTLYYNSQVSTIENAHLFPLAGIGTKGSTVENFYIGTYLTSQTQRILDVSWWLRSGNASYSDRAYLVTNADGSVYDYLNVTYSYSVRPAFVLKLI